MLALQENNEGSSSGIFLQRIKKHQTQLCKTLILALASW